MEQPEAEKSCPSSEDGGLTRNRSFKSKQLVRSQAIRESTSPPRTVSPYMKDKDSNTEDTVGASERDNSDTSSHSDRCTVISNDRLCDKKQPVEIQITSGSWESEAPSEQRLRTRRWLGHRPHSDSSRDLLSYGPRLTCVCGACACPYCRGKRRKNVCPTKQDSGIVCSDDCPDCTDSENGPNGNGSKKSGSFDADDQTFYCRCPERREKPKSYSVSGTDFETEPSVPELVSFIKETLNKNPRDRITMLKIEKELHALVSDSGRCVVRFPVMTSYGRMLVHRCAALFHLAHRLDHHDHDDHHHPHHNDHHRAPRVLVSKSGTSGGRIPCTSFREWCTTVFPQSPPRERHDRVDSNEENVLAKSILKRSEAGRAQPAAAAGRSKSLEQREREYERVRRRIFSTDNCTQDESQWPWLSGPVKLLTPETGRNKLLKVQSLESRNVTGTSSSARGPVSKSHSFGGYSGEPPPQRLLSRQGDLASSSWRLSRLSPSSSGYKTLSLRSTDSVTPSPTGGASPEPVGVGSVPGAEGATFLWAVTDMSAVPPGALVIHPQTGRPLTNPDGSVYHFDRNNPPVLYDAAGYVHRVSGVGGAAGVDEEKVDLNNEKRRGKLEKQHSFIDNDCECQPSEECRTKCCCECRRHDGGEKVPSAKNSPRKMKPSSIPSSPMKKNYETKPFTPEPKQEPETVYEDQTETYETQKPDVETPNEIKYEANVSNNIVKRFESPTQRPSDQPQNLNQNQRLEIQKKYEPNQRSVESNKRSFENQNSFEASQRSFENQNSFETTQRSVEVNQRSFEANQRSFEANQRSFDRYEKPFEQRAVKEEVYQQNYVQTYRNEEIISPQNIVSYHQQEVPEQQVIVQAKVTPVQLPDPNIRPMSLTNVMYPAAMPHNAYPYVNTCRIEQVPAQMYQQLVQTEDHKQMASSPHTDTTFRIDPSYPYAADFNTACGACDPAVTANAAATNMHAARGYNMTYNQMEVPPGLIPSYTPNVLIQQPAPLPAQLPAHGYPYQDQIPLQWQNVQQPLPITQNKLLVQELYPLVYPAMCPNVCPTVCPTVGPPYNLVYPHLGGQMLPQPYPIVQPIYPMLDKQTDRRNLPRPKRTPSRQYGDDTKTHDDSDLQLRIQQIKEQISRRNSGTGLLGSCPATYNGNVVGTATDDTQLSSAARAIVNSIRNLQVKNNYQPRAPVPREPLHAHARRRDEERRARPLCRPPCLIRQMSPGTWCRRSPGPLPTGLNQPRRPHPDARNGRR